MGAYCQKKNQNAFSIFRQRSRPDLPKQLAEPVQWPHHECGGFAGNYISDSSVGGYVNGLLDFPRTAEETVGRLTLRLPAGHWQVGDPARCLGEKV